MRAVRLDIIKHVIVVVGGDRAVETLLGSIQAHDCQFWAGVGRAQLALANLNVAQRWFCQRLSKHE